MAHFEFRDMTSRLESNNGEAVLVIEGKVVNVSGERRLAPSIRYCKIGFLGRRKPRDLIHKGAGFMGPGQNHGFSFQVHNPLSLAEKFSLVLEER